MCMIYDYVTTVTNHIYAAWQYVTIYDYVTKFTCDGKLYDYILLINRVYVI